MQNNLHQRIGIAAGETVTESPAESASLLEGAQRSIAKPSACKFGRSIGPSVNLFSLMSWQPWEISSTSDGVGLCSEH